MTAILVSIIANLLRFALIAAVGWLLKDNVIDASQSSTIQAFYAAHSTEVGAFVVTLLSALGWKAWSWLGHFQFVAGFQKAAGLPVTGHPNAETVDTMNKVTAAIAPPIPSPIHSPQTQTDTAMKTTIALVLAAAASLTLGACSTSPSAVPGAPTAATAPSTASKITADVAAFQMKLASFNAGALSDIQSPAFLSLVGSLTSTALSVGVDAAAAYTGNPGAVATAVVAGVEGGANALQYIKALPTVASKSAIVSAMSTGAGDLTVAGSVAPAVATLITAATAKAGVDKQSAITTAVLNGLYALRGATTTTALTTAGNFTHASYRVAYAVLNRRQ